MGLSSRFLTLTLVLTCILAKSCIKVIFQKSTLTDRILSQSPKTRAPRHGATGGPNISIVSITSDRWSRNELTDTLRIRASSALHLLKHRDRFRGMITHFRLTRDWEERGGGCSHRQRAAGHTQMFADAASSWLSVRRQGPQGDDGLWGRREGDVQRAEGRSRKTELQHKNFFFPHSYNRCKHEHHRR